MLVTAISAQIANRSRSVANLAFYDNILVTVLSVKTFHAIHFPSALAWDAFFMAALIAALGE